MQTEIFMNEIKMDYINADNYWWIDNRYVRETLYTLLIMCIFKISIMQEAIGTFFNKHSFKFRYRNMCSGFARRNLNEPESTDGLEMLQTHVVGSWDSNEKKGGRKEGYKLGRWKDGWIDGWQMDGFTEANVVDHTFHGIWKSPCHGV